MDKQQQQAPIELLTMNELEMRFYLITSIFRSVSYTKPITRLDAYGLLWMPIRTLQNTAIDVSQVILPLSVRIHLLEAIINIASEPLLLFFQPSAVSTSLVELESSPKEARTCAITNQSGDTVRPRHIFPIVDEDSHMDIRMPLGVDPGCFFSTEDIKYASSEFDKQLSEVQSAKWNIICIEDELCKCLRKPLFGLECLGVVSQSDHDIVRDRLKTVPPPHEDDDFWKEKVSWDDFFVLKGKVFQKELERLGKQGPGELETASGSRVFDGQTIEISLPSGDGVKMERMLQVQWRLVVLAALAGGCGDSRYLIQ
ncbi:hypothetical protein QBC38DRAFT_481617 [Podospora fimiseda]|uniref:HNH nuclease domain-containing protein n=1 Tax=Podospora fimiseda TaxID=252190 RepID=A0AAN7BMB5_9PEZI|nr:hypothetical protein QBC38DRAFT_481617 [Podospora fimiseda]